MKSGPIETEFRHKGVVWGNMLILTPDVALEMIEQCRQADVRVLGIDAFRLTEHTIQPVMEHSPDYSGVDFVNWRKSPDCWDRAEAFFREQLNSGFHFEVVIDEEEAEERKKREQRKREKEEREAKAREERAPGDEKSSGRFS